MALWRDGGFAENTWLSLNDEAAVPDEGAILVSLARWRRDKSELAARAAKVGVEIAAGKDALEHLGDVADRPLVALRFDKFADGRAFERHTQSARLEDQRARL